MRLIGILSDTHSCWDDRFALHLGDCDEIWHAGDIGDIDTLNRLRSIGPTVRAVAGNIDGQMIRRECPETIEAEIEGVRLWMTHIGGYPGRYRPGVASLLRSRHIGVMITGHSHILKVMHDPATGALHINPGAAGHHGWQSVRTLVKLTLDNGAPRGLDVIELAKNLKRQ